MDKRTNRQKYIDEVLTITRFWADSDEIEPLDLLQCCGNVFIHILTFYPDSRDGLKKMIKLLEQLEETPNFEEIIQAVKDNPKPRETDF